jgi:hypothetical protein
MNLSPISCFRVTGYTTGGLLNTAASTSRTVHRIVAQVSGHV